MNKNPFAMEEPEEDTQTISSSNRTTPLDSTGDSSIPFASTEPSTKPPDPSPDDPTPAKGSGDSEQKKYNETRPKVYTPSSRTGMFRCPICLEEIHPNDLLYYCASCRCTYNEREAKKNEKIRKIRWNENDYICHNRSMKANRICPNCEINAINKRVPIASIRLFPNELVGRNQNREFRLCMTGASSAGKTQYITQLLNYITRYHTPGIRDTSFIDRKTKKIRQEIIDKVFKEGRLVATPRGYLDPLLYDIRDIRENSYKSVFYDIAGEDFTQNEDDTDSAELALQRTIAMKAIWTSPNIILIVDPTTLPYVQDHPNVIKLKSQKGKTAEGDTGDSLTEYKNQVDDNRKDGERFRKNHVNLAVVFTKMDLFYGDHDLPQDIKNESSHAQNGQFDLKEVECVSEKMKEWVLQMGGSRILEALKSYENAMIFGVSNGSDELLEHNEPRRILDPYLWLLYKNDIIRQ